MSLPVKVDTEDGPEDAEEDKENGVHHLPGSDSALLRLLEWSERHSDGLHITKKYLTIETSSSDRFREIREEGGVGLWLQSHQLFKLDIQTSY